MGLRDAVLDDLPAVTEIYNSEVLKGTSTFDTEPRGSEEGRAWFDAHRPPAYPLVVAEERGEVVAWASLSPWSDRGAYAHTVEGSLFVREGFRGEGIGVRLTRELIERAGAAGHHVLLARIEAANGASRAILIGAGFRLVGVMHEVGRKFGRNLDVELYELVLEKSVAGPAGSGESGNR
jgi:L-amino acid N-acyltransferase YncA